MATIAATARRRAFAERRIDFASRALAREHSLDIRPSPRFARDPDLKRVEQLEHTAEVLERVAVATGAATEEEVMSQRDPVGPQTTAEGQGPAQPNEDGLDPSMPEGVRSEGRKSEDDDGEDLSALTVVELKERAKAANIEGYSSMKKDELIEALGG